MDNPSSKVEQIQLAGIAEGRCTMRETKIGKSLSTEKGLKSLEELRIRTRQLSLREQLERNHFHLERLYAASAGLIQALNEGDAHVAIGEILGNLIGSEEAAIFHYNQAERRFAPAWSIGVSKEMAQQFSNGTGMMWRSVSEG